MTETPDVRLTYPTPLPPAGEAMNQRIVKGTCARRDKKVQAYELSICAADPAYFISNWCWTYDPREERMKELPFVLYPRQVEFVRWLQDREKARENGCAVKSRETGMTWVCCAYAVHGWLFRDRFAVGFGSLQLDDVDQLGNMGTILEKCRFLIRTLPDWMRPAKYRPKDHGLHKRIINPDNGSIIVGDGGDDMFRSGRLSMAFIDEAAHLADSEKVDAAVSYVTRVRIDVSTPRGMDNSFYRKVHSGDLPVFRYHWKDDPRKNAYYVDEGGRKVYPWYEEEKAKHDAWLIAQELDLDFTGSVQGVCIPGQWVRAAVDLIDPGDERVAGLAREAGQDVGEEHDLSVYISRRGPACVRVEAWTGCMPRETAWLGRDLCLEDQVTVYRFDATGIGSGVAGEFDPKLMEWVGASLPFKAMAIMTGERPTDTYWPKLGKTSKELFRNLRAELWWQLRSRFEKTYEYVEKGIDHPLEELISIPDHPELIAQLSTPTYKHDESGKIILQPKATMTKSPDYADAAVLCWANLRPAEIWVK